MLENKVKEVKCLLKTITVALLSVLPTSKIIKKLIDNEFSSISSSEAYQLLWFLLNAAGVPLEISCTSFENFPGHPSWKDCDTYTKAKVERYKSDIIQAIKGVLQEGTKVTLRKTDLLAPNNLKFFECCSFIAQSALNHQLKKRGININSEIRLNALNKDEFLSFVKSFHEQEREFDEKSDQSTIREKLSELKTCEEELNRLRSLKAEINSLLREQISKCPQNYKNQMQEVLDDSSKPMSSSVISLHKIIASWSKELDEESSRNNIKLNKLRKINEDLTILCNFIDNGNKTDVIDGSDIIKQLPPELLAFASENKIEIVKDGILNLDSLFKILILDLPPSFDLEHIFKAVTDFKHLSQCNGNLFESLKEQEKKLKAQVEEISSTIVHQDEPSLAIKKYEEYFITVPEIRFFPKCTHQQPSFDIFIDLEFIEKSIK